MKSNVKRLAWILILTTAAYDCYFAAKHTKLFLECELNPLARIVFTHLGVAATIVTRLGVLAFGAWAAGQSVKPARLVTPTWAAAHLYLAAVYWSLWDIPPY